MANEFVVKNGLIVSSGSVFVTGSVTVTSNISASSAQFTSVTGSSFTGSFVGDGSQLTNLPAADLSSATLQTVDGNNIPNRSIADVFTQLAVNGYIDLDFND
jgi:hypothetical protein